MGWKVSYECVCEGALARANPRNYPKSNPTTSVHSPFGWGCSHKCQSQAGPLLPRAFTLTIHTAHVIQCHGIALGKVHNDGDLSFDPRVLKQFILKRSRPAGLQLHADGQHVRLGAGLTIREEARRNGMGRGLGIKTRHYNGGH